MHEVRRAHHASSERRAERLVSKAHSENRHPAAEVPKNIHADSCLKRRARSRRNYDALWTERLNFADRDLVVPTNLDLCPQLTQVLNQVVCKRIVVVENKNHVISIGYIRIPVFLRIRFTQTSPYILLRPDSA